MKKQQYQVRQAVFTDLALLKKVFLLTRQDTFYWQPASFFKVDHVEKAFCKETIFLAEEKKGQIVGFVSIYEKEKPLFIHHFFVLPTYQRKGVGQILMQTLLDKFALPYRLKCLIKNEKAIAFYLKNNWYAVEEGICEEGNYLVLELS